MNTMKIAKSLTAALLLLSMAGCSKKADGQGSASLDNSDPATNAGTIGTGEWIEAEDGTITPEIQEMCDKAFESLIGVVYKPVELLATQVVSGTNYKILCDSEVVIPGSEAKQVIVTVYQHADGTAEVLSIDDAETASAQIANPFTDVTTLDEALSMTGIPFSVPETVEGFEGRALSISIPDMVQAVYGSENKLTVRKARSSQDISGDYNVYETSEEKDIGGKKVTLKSNSDGVRNITWFDGDYSYAVVSSSGLSAETAESLVNSIN